MQTDNKRDRNKIMTFRPTDWQTERRTDRKERKYAIQYNLIGSLSLRTIVTVKDGEKISAHFVCLKFSV